MICQVCGGSGTVLRQPITGKFRDWFRRCTSEFCRGGVVTSERIAANPRPNQLDWWGAFFARTFSYFTAEVPIYGSWRVTARCAVWDSRDDYEFTLTQGAAHA